MMHPVSDRTLHNLATSQPASVSAAAAGSGDSSSASGATVTANDFLTLLVAEMQNQDPTAATDPNEYVNQLVNVNSLQQLVSINQTLTDAFDPTASSQGRVRSGMQSSSDAAGNLAAPPASAAAQRVAHALTAAQVPH